MLPKWQREAYENFSTNNLEAMTKSQVLIFNKITKNKIYDVRGFYHSNKKV